MYYFASVLFRGWRDHWQLENGRIFRFPFEHKAIIQIAMRAAFRDGYNTFIDSDTSLDNIMALSATAACCSLREFSTGVFEQIDFSYAAFHKMYERLMKYIRDTIRTSSVLLSRWQTLFQIFCSRSRWSVLLDYLSCIYKPWSRLSALVDYLGCIDKLSLSHSASTNRMSSLVKS